MRSTAPAGATGRCATARTADTVQTPTGQAPWPLRGRLAAQHAWQELLRGVLTGPVRFALEQRVRASGPARWVRDLPGPWALRFLADGHQVLPHQTERFWSRRSARQRQRALGTRHVIEGRVLWSSEVVLRR